VLPTDPTSVTFPPIYYDTPVTCVATVGDPGHQIVTKLFSGSIPLPVTATITAGGPYFKVSAVTYGDDNSPPSWGSGWETKVADQGSGGAAGGNQPVGPGGVLPIVAQTGDTAIVSVTVEVPTGSPLPLGALTGTLVIAGRYDETTTAPSTPGWTKTVTLNATLYGAIIGKVSVQPETVVPGQPVQIEVLNSFGEPISDPAVTVTIQGIPGNSRWEQYATAGTRTLCVVASDGERIETGQGSVTVDGTPMKFTLNPPSTTQLPIIEATNVPGLPYAGNFTLGTPRSLDGTLVAAPRQTSPPTDAAKQVAPASPVGPGASMAPGTAPAAITASAGILAEGTPPPLALVETSYTWDFGDGSPTVTTEIPAVTHDFFPAVAGDAVTHLFDVSCTATDDNLTVKRTIVLHSAYGLCKRTGVVVPPITGAPTYAPSFLGVFAASMIVHNLEPLPLTLLWMAIVPMSDNASVAPPAPQFTAMATPQTIAANSASALGAVVPFSALSLGGPPANAFTLYFRGVVGDNTPVYFSIVFRISALYSGLTTSTTSDELTVWDHTAALGMLNKITTAQAGAISATGADVDAATRTITVPLLGNAHDLDTVIQATTTIRAGLTSIAAAAAPVTPTPAASPDNITIDPTDPPPVAPGKPCYPDDISDAAAASANAQQLVCELTSGASQTVTIPSAFQNAQAGDVILSPAPTGDGDLIAAMFLALSPPQHHGHSGIMTADMYEITHCTASIARISTNVNTDAVGIPTSLPGDMLQYAWPGSLVQTIDEATNSVPWIDPGGTTYWETSFNFDDRGSPQQLIPPLVIKPLPENEQTARPKLRQAADLARSKGARYGSQYDSTGGKDAGTLLSPGGCYYSFYNYTKPQISAGFTDPAPAAAGWAEGMSPAVCSSFVWMCMKETGIPCVSSNADETLADFTAAALATGEPAVDPNAGDPTLDGLVYYSQEVRQAGAAALYSLFMEQAQDKELGLGGIPGINDTVAGPIADQLLNCFASGNPNMVNDSSWKNPGDGNAVSPDNIALWSPPYFGYAEPLQYLPSHTDQYTPSEWVFSPTHGTISGTVTRSDNGQPVAGALVWANLNMAGMWAYTGSDGSYTLPTVPYATYALKAQATLTVGSAAEEFTNDTGTTYTLTAANNGNGGQNLVISPPPANYRQINIQYQINADHGDANPGDATGVEYQGPYQRSLYVNPGQMIQQFGYKFDYAGGGYYSCSYTFNIALLQDQQTIQYTVKGVLADDQGKNVQDSNMVGPWTVGAGETVTGASFGSLEYSQFGYHNGPVNFTWNISNGQQTG
jgi:hypothetical protein